MKYFSVDIEATAIAPEQGNILEVSIVLDDWETHKLKKLPHLHFGILPPDKAVNNLSWCPETFLWAVQHGTIERYLKSFNYYIDNCDDTPCAIRDLATPDVDSDIFPMVSLRDAGKLLEDFVNLQSIEYGLPVRPTIWGKNIASYDYPWMKHHALTEFVEDTRQLSDVGVLWLDADSDEKVPRMKDCLITAGLEDNISHNAYEDALQNIMLIRSRFNRSFK